MLIKFVVLCTLDMYILYENQIRLAKYLQNIAIVNDQFKHASLKAFVLWTINTDKYS